MSHKWGCACAGLVAKVHIQWLNPIKFSKSTPKEHTHIRNNRKAVLKTAAHSATPTQPSYITLRLTPAVCRERTEQLESWTMCVCVCVWKRAQLGMRALVWMCVFTCARSYKNASALVAQGTASARFNSPLNATVTPVRLCVAAYLHWRRYGKNLGTSKSWRLHGSSQLWPQ